MVIQKNARKKNITNKSFTKRKSSLKGVYLCPKTKLYYALLHFKNEEYKSKLFEKERDAYNKYEYFLNKLKRLPNSKVMERYKVEKIKIKRPYKKRTYKKREIPDNKNTIKRHINDNKSTIKRKNLSFTDLYLVAHNQNHLCNICQDQLNKGFQGDHIIPLQYGGTNNFSNFQALCHNCHLFKTNRIDKVHIKIIFED